MITRQIHAFLLLLIIGFAAFLRLSIAHWGLENHDGIHRYSTHFDEAFSVKCCQEIDIKKLDYNPESGQIEGSLMYYMWYCNALALHSLGVINENPNDVHEINQDSADFIYCSRLLVILCDLLTVLFIYLTVMLITRDRASSLIAAFLFAIIPFEILHSAYMRTHVPCNTFLAAIIYYSSRLYFKKKINLIVIVGILLGFSIAMRYTNFVFALIPALILIKLVANKDISHKNTIRWLGIMLIVAILALIAGNPSWVLYFEAVKNGILHQSLLSNQLGIESFKNIWYYVSWIIPFGTFSLFVIFYTSIIGTVFIHKYQPFATTFVVFSLVYFIPASIFYPILTIRTALPLFVIFSILSGIYISHLLGRQQYRAFYIIALVLMVIPTLLFDIRLVSTLSTRDDDPFVQVHSFFEKHEKGKAISINVLAPMTEMYTRPNMYHLFRDQKAISINNHSQEISDSSCYIIVSQFDYSTKPVVGKIVGSILSSGKYTLVRHCKNELKFCGIAIDFESYAPHDFMYPFQSFYIYKRNK